MRRLILGTFLICAACGGGARNDSGAVNQDPAVAENRASRTMVALSADAQATIASYEKAFGQDLVESCLQEWIEGEGSADPNALVFKPDIGGLRRFLSECLGVAVPGDARADTSQAARADGTDSIRTARPGVASLRMARPAAGDARTSSDQ